MSSARPPLHFILGDGVIGQAVADELARLGQPLTLASRSGPKGASPHAHTRVDALDAAALRAATRGCSHLYLTLGLPYVTAVWQRDWPRVMQGAIDAAVAHDAALVFFAVALGPGFRLPDLGAFPRGGFRADQRHHVWASRVVGRRLARRRRGPIGMGTTRQQSERENARQRQRMLSGRRADA